MKKILFIIGTRPEVIKMAPVIKVFQASSQFNSVVYTSGQHTDLVDQAITALDLKVDGKLSITRSNNSLTELTRKLKEVIAPLIDEENPDLVFVHGDTSTALVTAMIAYSKKRKLAHVEAGLRTHDMSQPYPEEANRQLIARMADYHFAPTAISKKHLMDEGIDEKNIIVTGNTGIDALLWAVAKIRSHQNHVANQENRLQEKPLLVVTAHRRENQKTRIPALCKALKQLASNGQVDIAFIAHPNPKLRAQIQEGLANSAIKIFDPMGYLDFVRLMSKASIILTDSGGIQEEAPSLQVPVLVLREVTERPEAVTTGGLEIVGSEVTTIVSRIQELLQDQESYKEMILDKNPYGDGKAAQRILDYVLSLYSP